MHHPTPHTYWPPGDPVRLTKLDFFGRRARRSQTLWLTDREYCDRNGDLFWLKALVPHRDFLRQQAVLKHRFGHT